ncbi:hypothetical protein L195_g014592 [Trifolium pratense]|uniref:Uncharacterized protein n=1 Tax=Trifolium pratense TaxID=57577 RepID=A0A2K3PRC8_TRIPR|nr:hypothetical protein L195_g014592 [Trifolium pratense]
MAYSTLQPPYYHPITTHVPDPSPYYTSHTPPFYPQPPPNTNPSSFNSYYYPASTVPTPPPPPNPNFPSYPHHLYHPSYHSIPPSYSTPTTIPLDFPSYPYPTHSNYDQNTSFSPSTITQNTTHILQQQPHVVQPFYHQQPHNTTYHIDLPFQKIQTAPPTFVSSQEAPPSLQQQIHPSYTQPVSIFQNPETT